MGNLPKFALHIILGSLLVLFAINFFQQSRHTTVSYNTFKSLLQNGAIQQVVLGDDIITATLEPERLKALLPPEQVSLIEKTRSGQYRITTPHINDPTLIPLLEAKKVSFMGGSQWYTSLPFWMIAFTALMVVWLLLINRLSTPRAVMEIGKSKAKLYMQKITGISFKDVGGVDEAKAELLEIIAFLKNPKRYRRLGARIPKGVLLVGPPGTGKTLLARAVAGEAGVPFFSISGSAFVELYVGIGAARIRDLFAQARNNLPAIIFIDELDAVGKMRGASLDGVNENDEKQQTLNQLLAEMDGFDPHDDLIILAATNRPEILDPALLRAGRFDRHVLVDLPDKVGRLQILTLYLKKIKTDNGVDPEMIAGLTPGFSGADLANLVNEAALLATRRNAQAVNKEDFMQAIERLIAGLEKKNRIINPVERRIVAYHEMGHTLVALTLPGVDHVHKVSILPRGFMHVGYTIQRPMEDRYLMTKEELENKLTVLLGGRAAEYIIFEQLSTGAVNDLTKATEIARSMVMRYGMYEPLGQVVYDAEQQSFLDKPGNLRGVRNYSEETAEQIDKGVRKIIATAFEKALAILNRQRDRLEIGAALLLEKETLDEKDLEKLATKKQK